MFLPGFSTLGSTGPIEKLKGGHEGEKRVTVYEYILQDDGASERIISDMSIRRSRHFMEAVKWLSPINAYVRFFYLGVAQLTVKPKANVSCQLKFWTFFSCQLTPSTPSTSVLCLDLFFRLIVLYLQIFNTQNLVLFKISAHARGFILKMFAKSKISASMFLFIYS